MLNNLQDIQLAILCCKLQETDPKRPLFHKILQENFIESGRLTNDCWLVHIGHVLSSQHIDSVNCLYEFNNENDIEYDETGKKSCLSWPGNFEPGLSSFHPSAVVLAEKLKDSINVKRELENQKKEKEGAVDIFESFWGEEQKNEKEEKVGKVGKELKENPEVHLIASLEYYLGVNNPILGLLHYLNHKQAETSKS